MKKINQLLIAATLMFSTIISAQSPNLLSYQAVVRNSTNNIVINQSVGMRISILQGSAAGTAVYVETQTATSNANGLVSLQIGGGTVVTGTFANINWAGNTYFVKTETDPAGGTNYSITGTQQLLSVPYALNAKNGTPIGGTANQVLAKVDAADYNTTWVTPASGSADNLGNHTATQALNMSNQNITNVNNTTTNRLTFQEMVYPTFLNYSSTLTTVSSAQLDTTGYSYIKISGVALGTPATITGLAGGVQGKIVTLMIDVPYTLTFNSQSEPVGFRLFNTWSSTNAGQNLPYNGTRYIVTLMFDNNIWQVINYML